MKKLSRLLGLLIMLAVISPATVLPVLAQTEASFDPPICGPTRYVSGTLTGADLWWDAGYVYVMDSDVTVPAGSTLRISASVVKAKGSASLYVNGKLEVVGTTSYPHWFTSWKDDSLCGDTNNDGAGSVAAVNDWGWIEFGSSSDASSVIRRMVIRYSGWDWDPYYNGAAIRLNNVSPILENITFTDNYRNAVEIVGGNWLTKSWNETSIIYWLRDDVTIPAANTLTIAPGVNIKAGESTSLYINGKLMADGTQVAPITFTSEKDDSVCGVGAADELICDTNNDGAGSVAAVNDWGWIEFGSSSDASSVIRRMVIRYSGWDWDPYYNGAAIRLNNVSPILENITFTDNYRNAVEIVGGNWLTKSWNETSIIYWLRDDVTIPAANTLTIAPGVNIKAGESTSLYINGKLMADGTQVAPITFTSEKDDSVCGVGAADELICDTNNDGAGSVAAVNDWGWIEFGSSSDASSVIRRAVIRYSGWDWDPYYHGAAIRLNTVSPTIVNVLFKTNYRGLELLSGARPSLTCNEFIANQDYGMYNNQPATLVTAEGQWWGNVSGPNHTSNPEGTGDRVSDGIDFIPWALAPCTSVSYSISGRVTDGSGSPLPDVKISVNQGGTLILTATTNSKGDYTASGLTPRGSYGLTPVKTGYLFTPMSSLFVDLNSNLTEVNFSGTLLTYKVSGRVTDGNNNGIQGVTISDGVGHTATTNSSGDYVLSGLPLGSYMLAPSKAGFSFTPSSKTVTITQADVTNQNFTGMTITCSTATAVQPILLVTGWGGSAGKKNLGNDENMVEIYKSLQSKHYIEGCNLFYAKDTDPSKWQDENAKIIQDDLCRASQIVDSLYPGWTGSFDIIAHSYGGLRTRAYLENPDLYGKCTVNAQKPKVRNLITLGTPHNGDLPSLPLSFLIGVAGISEGLHESPALLEMLPELRGVYNLTHSQPDDVNYYLVTGDSRTQTVPSSTPLKAISDLFPEYKSQASDMAVHENSGHALGLSGLLPFLYPKLNRISTHDVHGRSSEWIVSGLNQMDSYVSPSGTFDNYIWRIIQGTYTGAPVVSANQSGAANSVMNWVAQQTSVTTTPAVAQMDIAAGSLSDSQSVVGSFEISNEGDTSILLAWDAGSVNLVLIDPLGNIIPQDGNFASFAGGFGWITSYHLSNPPVGTWSYIISAQALTTPAIYRLAAIPATPITVVASLPTWLANNDPITITANVAYNGTTPITGGSVTARIQRPDSNSESAVLYDDGNHQDGAANDGCFGAGYSNTSLGGIYGVLITAAGTYSSETYTRTATANFTIAPASAGLGNNYTDRGVDDNSNGVYEWLEVSTPVVVTQVGTYMVSAELYAGSVFIGQAFTERTLGSGPQEMALRFAGNNIFEKKVNGPYTLRNLMLFDKKNTAVLIQAVDNAYNTGVYQYLQFGQQSIYLPLVIR
jgi:hypothetical protein